MEYPDYLDDDQVQFTVSSCTVDRIDIDRQLITRFWPHRI